MRKSELQELNVAGDSALSAEEKETTTSIRNSADTFTMYSDVSTMIKWMLSVEESEILDHRIKDGDLVGLKAELPKGILKFQSNARQSNSHSQMIAYGPER